MGFETLIDTVIRNGVDVTGKTQNTFTPPNLANLQMWLDPSNGSTVTSAGGKASAISSISPATINFAQAVSVNQPGYGSTSINGLTTLHQLGTSFMTSSIGAGLGDFHFMAVLYINSTSAAYRCGFSFGSFAPSLYVGNTAGNLLDEYFNPTDHSSTQFFNAGEVHVVEFSRSGTTFLISIDGSDTTGSIVSTSTQTPLQLFSSSSSGSEYGQHDLGECFLYSAQLSSADRSTLRTHLINKWGAPSSYFNPKQLGNLLAWYDARQGITTPVSNHVGTWVDQSGTDANGKDQQQATDASRPTIATDAAFNNQLVVTATSGKSMASAGNWAATLTQPFTIYACASMTTNLDVLIGNANVQLLQSSGNIAQYAGSVGANGGSDSAGVYCFVFNGASSAAYRLDSTTPVSTGNPGANSATAMNFFVAVAGTIKVAQLIITSGADSQATRFNVMNYLGKIYGFNVT